MGLKREIVSLMCQCGLEDLYFYNGKCISFEDFCKIRDQKLKRKAIISTLIWSLWAIAAAIALAIIGFEFIIFVMLSGIIVIFPLTEILGINEFKISLIHASIEKGPKLYFENIGYDCLSHPKKDFNGKVKYDMRRECASDEEIDLLVNNKTFPDIVSFVAKEKAAKKDLQDLANETKMKIKAYDSL